MNRALLHGLLDAETARPMLARVASAASAAPLAVESVWIKPGRHFNVCWRVGDGDGATLASLCVVRDGEGAKALRRAGSDPRSGLPVAAMAADGVLAQAFPFDYRVDRLAECLAPPVVAPLLGEGAVDGCSVAAYRAGMRCQVRYTSRGAAKAYGKVAFDREPGRRGRVHAQLAKAAAAANTAMRVPPFLGELPAPSLTLVAAVGGETLHDRLAQAPDAVAVAAAMHGLRELHEALPAPADRVHTTADELALLETWGAWMTEVEPHLDTAVRRALTDLARSRPESAPRTFAHRDFYDRQLLVDGDRQWLLDVDTACTGDPELDLGNFLAHLALRGLQWERTAAHRDLEAVAAQAYGPAARPAVTRWYRRSTLLRLACAYRFRPRWRHLTPELLAEAAIP